VLTQAHVIEMMIAAARAGRRVVRLKAGDPFVLARGSEEVAALRAAGIRVEVVPGLTTALAGPALAGIPATVRGASPGVVIVSGHADEAYSPVLAHLEPESVTIVVLMGLGSRRAIARCLRQAGWPAKTPAAIVLDASRSTQAVWTGTLAALGRRDGIIGRERPGVIVIGRVVDHRHPVEVWRS
jgi:siroheme synthase